MFAGKLNTVFIIAIGFGMGIILLCMIFNIMNSLKAKDTEKVWFDTNSVAGLVFYGSAVIVIALFMTGHKLPGGIVLCIMFILPLLVMFLKEPLTNLVEKKPAAFEGGVGMFIVQGFFEMFEVLLSYFSNTLSFVRIGAYAVSHAAMMQVVLMLAGAENGSPNWVSVCLQETMSDAFFLKKAFLSALFASRSAIVFFTALQVLCMQLWQFHHTDRERLFR